MTRLEMEAVINSGGTVLWLGKILYTIGELPTQEEIDAVYAEDRGPSAYEVAVENGFVGTEAEWLASLVGPEGPQGPEGPEGPQGEPGTGSGNMNGPASSVDGNLPLFDGTTGELLKDSGVAIGSLATDAELSSGLATKQDSLGFTPVPNTRTVNGHALSADVTVTKSDVGLGNVDNTADTDKPVSTAQQTAIDAKVSDTAYNATTWDGDTTHAPSKNAVRDKIESLSIPTVSDTAYDATTWNGNTDAPSKNAVRDKIETMVDDTAYNATSWDGVTTAAPSKNAVRDKIESLVIPVASDTAYDATTWNGNTDVPTKNAIRDKLETMSAPDVQEFTSSGTWTKPSGKKMVRIILIGAGGGGGGGVRGSTSTAFRSGGAGGNGGSFLEIVLPIDMLGSTETVTVGAAGSSGAGSTSNNVAGSTGGTGGDTIFGATAYAKAKGGAGGGGGQNTSQSSIGATRGIELGGTSIDTFSSFSSGLSRITAMKGGDGGISDSGVGGNKAATLLASFNVPTGGGGGGKLGSGNVATNGGGTGKTSSSDNANSGAGTDNSAVPFIGGGGGAASSSTVGFNGGNGGIGAGGGGGGAAVSSNGGAGGTGGPGYALIVSF